MTTIPTSQIGDPPWEIARYFPPQGSWSEAEYLNFNANRGIEFVDGCVEFLPMPTKTHELIASFLYRALFEFVTASKWGKVFYAGYRVKIRHDQYREPDVIVMRDDHFAQSGEQFTEAADLVVEVVSASDPQRDLETKRTEYAAAGIAEYWIVDPRDQTVTVFTLPQGQTEYAEAGKYSRGGHATSLLLDGFQVAVDEVFTQD